MENIVDNVGIGMTTQTIVDGGTTMDSIYVKAASHGTNTVENVNQCDGCKVGAPYVGGNHHMPDGGFMGCTKDRYKTLDTEGTV